MSYAPRAESVLSFIYSESRLKVDINSRNGGSGPSSAFQGSNITSNNSGDHIAICTTCHTQTSQKLPIGMRAGDRHYTTITPTPLVAVGQMLIYELLRARGRLMSTYCASHVDPLLFDLIAFGKILYADGRYAQTRESEVRDQYNNGALFIRRNVRQL